MATIVTRAGKGSELVIAEVDANFTNLNNDKVETSRQIIAGTGLTGGGALTADRTLGIAPGGVGTTQLADGGVTSAKMASGAAAANIGYTPLNTANPSYTGTLTGGTGVINIGSGQVYKDGAGNVGIGTSSPAAKLHAHQNTADFVTLKVSNSATGAGALDGLDFVVGPSGEAYIYNRESQPLIFGTANAERGRFDPGGRLTLPYQPVATGAGWPTTAGPNNGTWVVIGLPDIRVNRGNHMSAANSRFVAPVAGLYRLTFDGMTVNNGVPLYMSFMVNGTPVDYGFYSQLTTYSRIVGIRVLSLNANDFVQVGVYHGMLHEAWGSFTVELIG